MTERAKEVAKLSIGAIVQGALILVTVVSLFKTLEAKADANEKAIVEHKESDLYRWADSDESFRDIQEDVERVEAQLHTVELQEIMRMLTELKADAIETKRVLITLERVDGNK